MPSFVSLWLTVQKATFALALVTEVIALSPASAENQDSESRVIGYQQCIDCHELPTEAWMRSGHASRSLAMLNSNSRSLRYARRLNIEPAELVRNSVCTECHATREQTDAGTVQVVHGVSCESCHGPAGDSLASTGWLEPHSGEATVQEAIGAGDLYSLAVRCHRCHSVSNEQVVAAGHVAGTSGFELTTWFSGEVRHNFAPDTIDVEDNETNNPASNVWLAKHEGRDPAVRKQLMYVVGQLADLEVNLHNRAQATKQGTFATSAASRAVAAHARLKQVIQLIEIAELQEAVAAVESVRSLLFLSPQKDQNLAIAKAADQVAKLAQKFTSHHDGRELAAIEPLLPQESKGQAYQP